MKGVSINRKGVSINRKGFCIFSFASLERLHSETSQSLLDLDACFKSWQHDSDTATQLTELKARVDKHASALSAWCFVFCFCHTRGPTVVSCSPTWSAKFRMKCAAVVCACMCTCWHAQAHVCNKFWGNPGVEIEQDSFSR